MRAIRVTRAEDGPNRVGLVDAPEPEPGEGEIAVAVEYSSVNYKDALALAGRPGILRVPEATAGIDAAGVVRESRDPRWTTGDRVVVIGRGLGETRDGGLAERLVVPGGDAVRIPDAFTTRQAAAIGTAGVTSALCVLELRRQGVFELGGDGVLVTGAGGGVGSIAVALLARAGARVTAVTGRAALEGALLDLGAAAVLPRSELSGPGRALQSARWSGAVDTVGGAILANVIAQTVPGGTVAACGNAAGMDLATTVAPFILRGVRLSGVNSVTPGAATADDAWDLLAADLDPAVLDSLTELIGLDEAIPAAARVLAGRVHGRLAVSIRS